jgi:antitoxin VapB
MGELIETLTDPRVTAEAAIKRERVRAWLDRKGLDGVILSRRDTFAWITCGGDSRVVSASETGVGHIVITRDAQYLVAYYMDAERMLTDQAPGQGYERVTVYWYEGDERERAKALAGKKVGADTVYAGTEYIYDEIKEMQWPLTDIELERTRWLGRQENELLVKVFSEVQPGMSEKDILKMVHCEIVQRGMDLIVPIVGSDERIFKYRHILATDKVLERYLLLGPVVRRWGLHALVSRTAYFGEPPAEVQKAFNVVATIEARLISSLRAGLPFKTILEWQKSWYAELGFPDGWTFHFQGGPTGYALVDCGQNQTDHTVCCPQAFSWFTTARGGKVEELAVLTEQGPEIASMGPGWPTVDIDTEQGKFTVPGMLIR